MSNDSKAEKSKPAFINPGSELWEEDGWLFRERPGVPVEIVRRAAEKPAGDMTPPNQNRHNYPSA
jgi:hypothetical protein